MASTPRIFVSHSHTDNDWCTQLVDALTLAGFDVWFDKQGLYVGDQWISKLETELESRDVFLIVLTPASWSSKWVRREFELALHRNKRILGVKHEPVELTGFITTLQILDAERLDAQRVAQQIGTALGVVVRTAPPAAPIVVGGAPSGGGLPTTAPRTDGIYLTHVFSYYHCLRFYPNGRVDGGSPGFGKKNLTVETVVAEAAKWSSGAVSATFTLTSGTLEFALVGRGSPTTYKGTVTTGGAAIVFTVYNADSHGPQERTYQFMPVKFK